MLKASKIIVPDFNPGIQSDPEAVLKGQWNTPGTP